MLAVVKLVTAFISMYIMCVVFVQRFEPRGRRFRNFHSFFLSSFFLFLFCSGIFTNIFARDRDCVAVRSVVTILQSLLHIARPSRLALVFLQALSARSTKPRTPRHRSLGGEKRRNRKRDELLRFTQSLCTFMKIWTIKIIV